MYGERAYGIVIYRVDLVGMGVGLFGIVVYTFQIYEYKLEVNLVAW